MTVHSHVRIDVFFLITSLPNPLPQKYLYWIFQYVMIFPSCLLPLGCHRRQMLRQYLRGFAFSSSACMCGSISTVLWLLALFSIAPSSPLTGAIEAFRPVSFWESLLRHTLVRVFNNNKQSPVQSNLKDGKKGETCITEVLAQKRKSQDTNLFSVPVRHVSSLLPFPFFHMRWSARKYFFNYLQMFIFFWLPQGQTQSLFYYHLFFLPQSQHRAISK